MFNENNADNELLSVFGNIILQFREERGLSQEQAAKICHIPLQKWLNLEEGTVWPEKNTMFQICRRLKFSREDFIACFIQFTDNVIAKYKNPSYADSSTSQPV